MKKPTFLMFSILQAGPPKHKIEVFNYPTMKFSDMPFKFDITLCMQLI